MKRLKQNRFKTILRGVLPLKLIEKVKTTPINKFGLARALLNKSFMFTFILLLSIVLVFAGDIIAKAGDFTVEGDVGIGTASPARKLHVQTTSTQAVAQFINNDGALRGLEIGGAPGGAGQHNYIKVTGTSSPLYFKDNSDDINLVIQDDGKVGIGTTTLSGFSSNADDLIIGDTSEVSGLTIVGTPIGMPRICYSNGTANGCRGYIAYGFTTDKMYFRVGNSDQMAIESDGDLSMESTKSGVGSEGTNDLCWDGAGPSYWGACGSVEALKSNIADLPFNWNEYNQLRPRKFNWKESGREDLGFVAEEINEVNPLYAEYSDGKLTGVKYKKLSALNVEAIQDLKSENEMLRQELCKKDNSYAFC